MGTESPLGSISSTQPALTEQAEKRAETQETAGQKYTIVERKMLKVLSDGLAHPREELHACLYDDQGKLSNIWKHITNLRKKLRPLGQYIACEIGQGTIKYRHVILLTSLDQRPA